MGAQKPPRRLRTVVCTALAAGAVLAFPVTWSEGATSPSKPLKFSGRGDRSLGTVVLKRTSVVRWTSTGKRFAVTAGSKKLNISGRRRSGQSFAAKGTYRNVKVKARGRWTLTFNPLPPP